jgi:Glycosyl transferase family 2
VLRRINPSPHCAPPGGIRLFARLRNEASRLPHFLHYYRNLGVDRFFLIDNDSSDQTTDLLGSEADVALFHAAGSYQSARGGLDWLNALLDAYGPGSWCLTVDADELLFYPGIERRRLPDLCRALEREGAEALACTMLDMYGEGPMSESPYQPGAPFLATCRWFDPAPYWHAWTADCPPLETYGGVRQRVFFPHWHNQSLGVRLSERFFNIANRSAVVRRQSWLQAHRLPRPPNLTKVPLVKWQRGYRYLASTHKISRVTLSAGHAVLLHFKFLGEFRKKAASEVRRREYFDGAREYRTYQTMMDQDPSLTLWYPGSVSLQDSTQLTELGLMREAAGWVEARAVVALGTCRYEAIPPTTT